MFSYFLFFLRRTIIMWKTCLNLNIFSWFQEVAFFSFFSSFICFLSFFNSFWNATVVLYSSQPHSFVIYLIRSFSKHIVNFVLSKGKIQNSFATRPNVNLHWIIHAATWILESIFCSEGYICSEILKGILFIIEFLQWVPEIQQYLIELCFDGVCL